VKLCGVLYGYGTTSIFPCLYLRSLCIKSQSSSYLSQGGWARTTNCLGVYSCESVLHSLWLSLFSHTGFSQSIIRLSRRPQLCTLLWESSPNTATKPTPLPSSMNTNQTSLVRFCEASLQQASVSEMFISDVVCRCARRLSHTQYYASLIKQIALSIVYLHPFGSHRFQNSSGRVGWEIKSCDPRPASLRARSDPPSSSKKVR